MKYFIRKRKDCISSFAYRGRKREKKWRRGIKKKRSFGELLRVCDEWRGSARIGCWRKREVEKMSKMSTLCRKLRGGKFEEVKLSLLEL